MGLFDEKYCAVCGGKIKLFSGNKLYDGDLCSQCSQRLPVWFRDFRSAAAEQIKAQLSAREENRRLLADFTPTCEIGFNGSPIFRADEKMGRFMFLSTGESLDSNPELLEFSRVRSAELVIHENKFEVFRRDEGGGMVSFSPKHYAYTYDLTIAISYDSPYFQEISVPLSSSSVNGGTDPEKWAGEISGEPSGGYRTDGFTTMKPADIETYQNLENIGKEIVTMLRNKK